MQLGKRIAKEDKSKEAETPKELPEGVAASPPKMTAALEDRHGRGAGIQDGCWTVSVSPLSVWAAGN